MDPPEGALMWSAFRPTGRPAQWALVGFLLVGLSLGLVVGVAVPPRGLALLPGLTAGAVAATGVVGPPRVVAVVGRWAAISMVLAVCLGFWASGRPWLAGLVMVVVAVLTSAASGIGPVGNLLGVLTTLGYVLALVISSLTAAREGATVGQVALHAVMAAAAGGLVAVAGAAWRSRDHGTTHPAASPVAPWREMWGSVRALDEHARDGLRRAVPLAICVIWFETTQSHDVLWVLISAMAVLLPTGKSTVEAALARVVATAVGVGLVGLLAGVLPIWVLVAVAVAALVLGLAYKPVQPILAGAASAFAVVVFVGTPTGQVASTASRRLIDTLVGAAIALTATYLLWPRDNSDEESAQPVDAPEVP